MKLKKAGLMGLPFLLGGNFKNRYPGKED